MAPADRLSALCELVHWVSPLVVLAVVCTATLGTFSASRSHARGILAPAWAGGLLAGLIGSFLLESPGAGDRDLALFFFYPFVFCRWFAGGFAPLWLWATFRHRKDAGHAPGATLGIVGAIGLASWIVTATVTVVVPGMYARDVAYWNRAFDPQPPALNTSEAQSHFSRKGRARIEKILHDRPHEVSAEVLRIVYNLGVRDSLSSRNIPPDIVATELALLRTGKRPSPVDRHAMMALARNPALDDATFDFLCNRGDDRVLSILSRHEKGRLLRLLGVVEQRGAQAAQDPRVSRAIQRAWLDLARRIKARQAELDSSAPAPNPPAGNR